jgi:hypothetical protein
MLAKFYARCRALRVTPDIAQLELIAHWQTLRALRYRRRKSGLEAALDHAAQTLLRPLFPNARRVP